MGAARLKGRILEEIARVENDFDVHVLLAVESGSRAWGFASPDSDYDVRLIYAHARDWYLSLHDPRDVIERMLPGDLDLSGWELRKALRLFAKCNLALNEWIGSPIVYASEPSFHARLAELVPAFFNPIAALHHYRRMALASLDDAVASRIGIKKLFYVLRPLLACRWILNARTQPPTEFEKLVDAEWVTVEERTWIAKMLRSKGGVAESSRIDVSPGHLTALRNELGSFESAADRLIAPNGPTDALEELMRHWVK